MKKKIFSLLLSFTIILTLLLPFATCFANISVNAVEYTADPTWYSADKSILEINDIPDFIAFMEKMNQLGTTDNGKEFGVEGNLAGIFWKKENSSERNKLPFEGQTVLLNTDIVLNPGITFSVSGPSDSSAYMFSRTTKQVGFGGIFDGQGHTISGLYISSSKGGSGSIFGVAGAATEQMNVVVRNLQIKNSFIENSASGVASIFSSAAFNSHVLIENVYSEAILKSNQTTTSTDGKLNVSAIGVNIGGFCATVGGDLTIVNSVYAGTFATKDTSATPKKYIGGMVGNITNKKLNTGTTYAGALTVENSAFYGKFEGSAVYMGKLSGDQTAGTTVTVNHSIFGGDIKPTNTTTPNYIGRFVGLCTSDYTININKSVYTPIYYKGTETSIKANYNKISDAISGSAVDIDIPVDANIKGEKDSLHEYINLYWIPNGTREGYPVPASYIALFGKERLKHDCVTALPLTATDLFEQLGAKQENDGRYTEESYRDYSDAYDDAVDLIFSDGADLSDINVSELKSSVEDELVTLVEEKRTELLATLGAKKINSNNYTTASYKQYSDAYAAIVNSLEAATTVDALNSINVSELKAAAEAKLVGVDSVKAKLLAELGEKKINDQYTASSYAEYVSAYDAIVSRINSAGEDIENINVSELKATAEAKLVGVDSVKAKLLAELGEKKINDQYTASSYAEYVSAYDEIVSRINSAGEDIESINVSELKAAAEAMLVVYVPEPEPKPEPEPEPEPKPEPETDAPETNAPETNAPETDAPETNTSETETESESDVIVVKKGCGGCNSTAAISAAIIVGMIGVALTTKKRRR